jgi:hypothetical protein
VLARKHIMFEIKDGVKNMQYPVIAPFQGVGVDVSQ